jgi:hypothetical protein
VRVEFWLTPAQAEKVREYVAKLLRAANRNTTVKGDK